MNTTVILRHLEALVACDTQNPPRRIDGDSRIFSYCANALPAGFDAACNPVMLRADRRIGQPKEEMQ